MSEWIYDDKKRFLADLKNCFSKVTDGDAIDAYGIVKPYGIEAACKALRELRDACKGNAWRPDLLRLDAIAKRIYDQSGESDRAKRQAAESAERVRYAMGKTSEQIAYAEAEAAAR